MGGNIGHHSDLQLLSDDTRANAPERDRFSEAPEVRLYHSASSHYQETAY